MVSTLVIVLLLAAVALGWRIRSVRRRRAEEAMVITTWPEIELHEPYGGWNANAYDLGTGRDRSPPVIAPLPRGSWSGSPRRPR